VQPEHRQKILILPACLFFMSPPSNSSANP
jgi:hypothetical protein